MENVMHS